MCIRDRYKWVLQKLSNLEDKCVQQSLYDADELDQIIDNIQEEIEESERIISSHENDRNWREGSKAISKMEESMGQLLFSSGEVYTKIKEESERRHKDDGKVDIHFQELDRPTGKLN